MFLELLEVHITLLGLVDPLELLAVLDTQGTLGGVYSGNLASIEQAIKIAFLYFVGMGECHMFLKFRSRLGAGFFAMLTSPLLSVKPHLVFKPLVLTFEHVKSTAFECADVWPQVAENMLPITY